MGIEGDDTKQKQYKRFQQLDEDWRNDMLSRSDDDIQQTIVKAALANVGLDLAKALDQDLARIKEELATANEMYREGKKTNNIRVEFLAEVLRGRGRDIPGPEDFVKGAQKKVSDSKEGLAEALNEAKDILAEGLPEGSTLTIRNPDGSGSATIEGRAKKK